MKGFLQEYGVIMVVVAVVLGMLAFGKTGYAKSIQDAILGSADHIVETGENITKKEIHVNSGDMLNIEGKKYIVLEKRESNQALVITASSIRNMAFQSTSRSDEQSQNTYEGSEVDNYLENKWYNSLSSTMKAAIQTTNIRQTSYNGRDKEYDYGYNGKPNNTINRHAFLPGVSEIGKVVDLKNKDKVKAFLNGNNIWTRHSFGPSPYPKNLICLLDYGTVATREADYSLDVRPAFVIDLSKIDYTEAGHVDYK